MQLIPAYILVQCTHTVEQCEWLSCFIQWWGWFFFSHHVSPIDYGQHHVLISTIFIYIYIPVDLLYYMGTSMCTRSKTYTSNSCEVESELFWLRRETCSLCGVVNVTSLSESRSCHSSSELLSNKQNGFEVPSMRYKLLL